MNWKQPKVGFAILVMLTAITLALAYQHNIDYQRYVQETKKWYVDRGIDPDILDFWPWRAWGNGGIVTLLGITTVILWIALPIIWLRERRNLRHKKSLLLLLLIAMLLFIPVNTAGAVESNVDILFAGDEELMSATEEWLIDPWFPWLGTYDRPVTEVIEEVSFPLFQTCFADKVGINLVFHGWISWDSDDGTSNSWNMLQEVMEQSGMSYWVNDPLYPDGGYWKFNTGDVIWGNAKMDILLAWTTQDMNLLGFSPFDWGAGIIHYHNLAQGAFTAQHELSHLYDCRHCSHDWCVMNPDYVGLTGDWQSTCKDYMIEHKDYFTRHDYPPWDINSDGVVDIKDATILSTTFGTSEGDRDWFPRADINNDGIVDVTDAVLLIVHWGEEY